MALRSRYFKQFKGENCEFMRDSSKEYKTQGIIEQFGHCVVFNLQDSGIFANVAILWRRKKSFNPKEIKSINKLLNQYKQQNKISLKECNIKFTLYQNETLLYLINGQLMDIIIYLRQKCSSMINLNDQPLPFIKFFQSNHLNYIGHNHEIIDETKIYQTKGNIFIIGRVIAINLEDSEIPGNKEKKHMTIFYRKKGWNENEMKKIIEIKNKWMKENKKKFIKFSLTKWKQGGSHSANIKGELFALCWYLRNECKRICSEQQSVPHVAMWQ